MFQPPFDYVSNAFRLCFKRFSTMFQTPLADVSNAFRICFNHLSTIFNTFFDYVSNAFSRCFNRLSNMFRTPFDYAQHVFRLCFKRLSTRFNTRFRQGAISNSVKGEETKRLAGMLTLCSLTSLFDGAAGRLVGVLSSDSPLQSEWSSRDREICRRHCLEC
jgi:hypothetical protein